MTLKLWDYKIKKNWRPKTDYEWIWYLERKINYDDWDGLTKNLLIKYFSRLKIDLGKKLILKAYLKRHAKEIQ